MRLIIIVSDSRSGFRGRVGARGLSGFCFSVGMERSVGSDPALMRPVRVPVFGSCAMAAFHAERVGDERRVGGLFPLIFVQMRRAPAPALCDLGRAVPSNYGRLGIAVSGPHGFFQYESALSSVQ